MIGKNIIILHGWGADCKKLDPLVKQLNSLKWNVFFPELPGFGDVTLSKIFNLEDYADYVKYEAKKHFGNRNYFIFGHSFGGRIAVKTSVENNKLSGLILCGSGGFSRGNLIKRFIFIIFAKVGKMLFIYRPLGLFFKKLLYKSAREHDYEKTSGFLKTTFRNVISENLRVFVEKITIPTLIFWGVEDKMTPYKDALYIKCNILNTKLISYENEGHSLPYSRPKELAVEIEKWYQSLR